MNMKTALTILRWLLTTGLCGSGILAFLWGLFCFLGGPDPGSGSGWDRLKFGTAFAGIGGVLFFTGQTAWTKLKQ